MATFRTNQLVTIFLTLVFFFVAPTFTNAETYLNESLSRIKRGILTFPPNSLLQFTVGISLAGDEKSNGVGIVLGLQENAQLPTNTEPFFLPNIVLAKHFSIYDHLKEFISRHGFDGSECLKKMVCEVAAIPFTGGILEEIVNFVLSPSQHGSTQASSNNSSEIYDSNMTLLLESEKLGKRGENCSTVYTLCEQSPLDLFSHYIFN